VWVRLDIFERQQRRRCKDTTSALGSISHGHHISYPPTLSLDTTFKRAATSGAANLEQFVNSTLCPFPRKLLVFFYARITKSKCLTLHGVRRRLCCGHQGHDEHHHERPRVPSPRPRYPAPRPAHPRPHLPTVTTQPQVPASHTCSEFYQIQVLTPAIPNSVLAPGPGQSSLHLLGSGADETTTTPSLRREPEENNCGSQSLKHEDGWYTNFRRCHAWEVHPSRSPGIPHESSPLLRGNAGPTAGALRNQGSRRGLRHPPDSTPMAAVAKKPGLVNRQRPFPSTCFSFLALLPSFPGALPPESRLPSPQVTSTHSVIIRPCTCTVQSLVIISQVELGPWIPLPSDFLPLLAPLQIFPLYGAVTADIPAKSPAFPLHRLISGCHGSEIACGNDSQKFRTSSCRYGGPHIQLPHHIFNFLRRMAATRLKVGF
jgi:hypothetical protein